MYNRMFDINPLIQITARMNVHATADSVIGHVTKFAVCTNHVLIFH